MVSSLKKFQKPIFEKKTKCLLSVTLLKPLSKQQKSLIYDHLQFFIIFSSVLIQNFRLNVGVDAAQKAVDDIDGCSGCQEVGFLWFRWQNDYKNHIRRQICRFKLCLNLILNFEIQMLPSILAILLMMLFQFLMKWSFWLKTHEVCLFVMFY